MAGSKPGRPGASKGKKGPTKGTGGKNKRSLEGRGPTPKAEDRAWHPAGKRKAAAERYAAAGGKGKPAGQAQSRPRAAKKDDDTEVVTGRNSVLEALRAKIPATAFYIAQRVEMDDRVKEMLSIATHREIPVMEVTRPELDRMAGFDGVHQGVALKVPPYEYAHPQDLLESVIDKGQTPLFVALDGITDPRNLGAIIRSTGAFGGHGVILPAAAVGEREQRRLEDERGGGRPHPGRDRAEPHLDAQGVQEAGRVRARTRRRRRRLAARARARRPPRRDRRRVRGQGPVTPGQRDLRPDRLDPDRRGHRVAERRDRGIRRPVPGLDAAGAERLLTSSGSCAGMNHRASALLPTTPSKGTPWHASPSSEEPATPAATSSPRR